MAFNPWATIHKGASSISDITKLFKSNQTSQPSDSLKMLPDGTLVGDSGKSKSLPVDNTHTHGKGSSSQGERITPRPDPVTFMGKGQVDAFSNLTAPDSVGRDGNVIAAADTPKPLTGQAPVLGTDYDRITPRPEEEATMGSYAGYKTT